MFKNILSKQSTISLSTGRKIPVIGFGGYQLKGEDGIKAIKAAINAGYTNIDAASSYKNQEFIRQAIEEAGVERKQLFITSKVGKKQQGAKKSREAVETIISKLNCQYVDLMLIHWPGVDGLQPDDPKNAQIRLETWNTLIEMQKQGKVKDVGVSNFLKRHLQHLLKNSEVKPAVNQIEIHPLCYQKQTIDFCKKHNIVLEAYSPLARQNEKIFKNKIMEELSNKYKKSISQICLRWLIQQQIIPVPKSKNEGRIRQNINIFDFVLTEQDMEKISSLRCQNEKTHWDPSQITY